MKTDQNPRNVALVSALIVSVVFTVAVAFFTFLSAGQLNWMYVAITAITGFLISYLVIYYFIERFIYRQIKIIFKSIHAFKTQSDRSRIRMGEDVLGDVNLEVAQWAEEKIQEVRELKAADNFRKEFIGNLAHELKTPLFNIQGCIETVMDGDLNDHELVRKFLQKASNSCERLDDLIKDLDQISRFESGGMPLQMSRFDVVALAKKSIENLESRSREKNITLRLANSTERPIYVEGDAGRIEQVFTNLLDNSISYGREGGETRIRFYDMADNILIEVADDGLGIAKQHLPRLFERFYRVDKSRSRNEGGSGLGLAICKHIIESHKQSISVRSLEGVGSTFSFTLRKSS